MPLQLTRRALLARAKSWALATIAGETVMRISGCGAEPESSVGGAVAIDAPSPTTATPASPRAGRPQGVIDVHIHANFRDYTLRRQGEDLGQIDYSPEGLAAEMDAAHVEQAISIGFQSDGAELSVEAGNPMGLDEPEGWGLLAERVQLVGGINPNRLDRANLSQIEQALESRRLIGLKLYLGYYPVFVDDPVYRPLFPLAAKYDVPVILHTGDTYSANAKVRYAHPLRIDDVAVDYRDTRFVIAHLGNPWTIDAAELMYKNPNVYADLSGFLVGDASYFADPRNADGFGDATERIREAFSWVEDPTKFLYGSDWPLVPMQPYIDFIAEAIDAEHHEQVFAKNALQVFRLRSPVADAVPRA